MFHSDRFMVSVHEVQTKALFGWRLQRPFGRLLARVHCVKGKKLPEIFLQIRTYDLCIPQRCFSGANMGRAMPTNESAATA